MRTAGHDNAGFTLVEVLLASTIGVFVALVAMGALKATTSAAEMVDKNIESGAELKYAAKVIATDLVNICRDRSYRYRKFAASVEETEAGMASLLTFYTLRRTKARPAETEGDVYEVEYYLTEKQEGGTALMRRVWPNPDKDKEPGGILSMLAENVSIFEVRYYDGSEWVPEWPEETRYLPELVEVTMVEADEDKQGAIVQSFVVNIARCTGNTAAQTGADEQEESGADASATTSGGQQFQL